MATHCMALPSEMESVLRKTYKERHVGALTLQLIAARILEPLGQCVDGRFVTFVRIKMNQSHVPVYMKSSTKSRSSCWTMIRTATYIRTGKNAPTYAMM